MGPGPLPPFPWAVLLGLFGPCELDPRRRPRTRSRRVRGRWDRDRATGLVPRARHGRVGQTCRSRGRWTSERDLRERDRDDHRGLRPRQWAHGSREGVVTGSIIGNALLVLGLS